MFKRKKEEFNAVEKINALIDAAISMRASDIHIEPFPEFIRVRFRIDGVLMKYSVLPVEKKEEIIAIIKVMANLDSTQKRAAQDGRIAYPRPGNPIEIRASVLPFRHGEKVVLRVQNTDKVELGIDNLELNDACLPDIKKIIGSKQGLVLVTGSTGSGKTTTIFSLLDYIDSEELNFVTLEDPIEYEIPGFIQVQISNELQMDFAEILRAVLRQDPDVLVIGEIRDRETAQVALRAALTGHLVIASIHTNDSIDTIIRLREMGVQSYLIAAALKLITYQRLVRVLCPHCRQVAPIEPNQAQILGIPEKTEVATGSGCKHCSNTGFFGRKPIFETLIVDDEVNEILGTSTSSYELKNRLRSVLRSTLHTEARTKIRNHTTSCAEALRSIL